MGRIDEDLLGPLQSLFDATSMSARHASISAIARFVEKNEGQEDSFFIIRVTPSMTLIRTVKNRMQRTVTYVVNRLIGALVSPGKFVRENSTCGLEVLLSVWKRTGLINEESLLSASRALLKLPSEFDPADYNEGTLGQLFGFRVLIALGFFKMKESEKILEPLWLKLRDIFENDTFLKFAGALLSDIMFHLSPATSRLEKIPLGYKVCLSNVEETLKEMEATDESRVRTLDTYMAQKQIRAQYFPSVVFALKARSFAGDDKALGRITQILAKNEPKILRLAVHETLLITAVDKIEFAALWPLLLSAVVSRETVENCLIEEWAGLAPSSFLMKCIVTTGFGTEQNEVGSGTLAHLAFQKFLECLIWAIIGKAYSRLMEENGQKLSANAAAFQKLDLDQFLTYIFSAPELKPVRKYWLGALCFKKHHSYLLALFGVRLLKSMFCDGSEFTLESLWDDLQSPTLHSKSAKKPDDAGQPLPHMSLPISVLDIVEQIKDHGMTPKQAKDCPSEGELLQAMFSCFEPMPLSDDSKHRIQTCLRDELAAKKLAPSADARVLLNLFGSPEEYLAGRAREEKGGLSVLQQVSSRISETDDIAPLAVFFFLLVKGTQREAPTGSPTIESWLKKENDIGSVPCNFVQTLSGAQLEILMELMWTTVNVLGKRLQSRQVADLDKLCESIRKSLNEGDEKHSSYVQSRMVLPALILKVVGRVPSTVAENRNASSRIEKVAILTLGDHGKLVNLFRGPEAENVGHKRSPSLSGALLLMANQALDQALVESFMQMKTDSLGVIWDVVLGASKTEDVVDDASDEDEMSDGQKDQVPFKSVSAAEELAKIAYDEKEGDVELGTLDDYFNTAVEGSDLPLSQTDVVSTKGESKSNALRKRLIVLLQKGAETLSNYVQKAQCLSPEDVDMVVDKLFWLISKVWELLPMVCRREESEESAHAQKYNALLSCFLGVCQILLSSLLVATELESVKTVVAGSGTCVAENCLVVFAQCVRATTQSLHQLLPRCVLNERSSVQQQASPASVSKKLKMAAQAIDLLGTLNDFVLTSLFPHTRFSLQSATALLNIEDPSETEQVKRLWAINVEGLLNVHPHGIRCAKCPLSHSKRKNVQGGGVPSYCHQVSHAEVALAAIALDLIATKSFKKHFRAATLFQIFKQVNSRKLTPLLLTVVLNNAGLSSTGKKEAIAAFL